MLIMQYLSTYVHESRLEREGLLAGFKGGKSDLFWNFLWPQVEYLYWDAKLFLFLPAVGLW